MSEISHHNDDNGNDEFNYSSHDSCPSSCQDRLTVESAVEGSEDHIFCKCCDFGCPECQCQWDEVDKLENFLEDDFILTRMIMPSAKSTQSCLQVFDQWSFLWTMGKGIQQELPDCFLKGVQSLLKKDANKEYTGLKTTPKRSKSICG